MPQPVLPKLNQRNPEVEQHDRITKLLDTLDAIKQEPQPAFQQFSAQRLPPGVANTAPTGEPTEAQRFQAQVAGLPSPLRPFARLGAATSFQLPAGAELQGLEAAVFAATQLSGVLDPLLSIGGATKAAPAVKAATRKGVLAVKQVGTEVAAGERGAISAAVPEPAPGTTRVFHGSAKEDLEVVAANPTTRQYDNATSQFGGFFSPDEVGARRYADPLMHGTGRVYPVDLKLEAPYEMSWREFSHYQDVGPDPTLWKGKLAELTQEAKAKRSALEAAGHDGVIVRNPSGEVIEISSFKDVPIVKGLTSGQQADVAELAHLKEVRAALQQEGAAPERYSDYLFGRGSLRQTRKAQIRRDPIGAFDETISQLESRQPPPPTQPPTTVPFGGGPPTGSENVGQKFLRVLRAAKPVREEQQAAYTAERARRGGTIAEIQAAGGGRAGVTAQRVAAKGEYPTVGFETTERFTPADVTELLDTISQTTHPEFVGPEKALTRFGTATRTADFLDTIGESLLGKAPTRSTLAALEKIMNHKYGEGVGSDIVAEVARLEGKKLGPVKPFEPIPVPPEEPLLQSPGSVGPKGEPRKQPSLVLEQPSRKGVLPNAPERTMAERYDIQEAIRKAQSALPGGERVKNSAWQQVLEVLGIPRAMFSSFDFSYPLRQGIILGPGHPIEFGKSVKTMLQNSFKERNAGIVDLAIRSDPSFEIAQRYGVQYTDRLGRFSTREEAYASKFIRSIPGIGAAYKVSERGAVTFSNSLRFGLWKNITKDWAAVGKTEADYKELALLLNRGTGRGTIPGNWGETGQAILNAGFFSPKWFFSRLQLPLSLITTAKTSPTVWREAAKDFAAFVATGISVLAFLKLSGLVDHVEVNPLSTDGGQIRIGNTRFNFWGGYQPLVRSAAQILLEERKTTTGRISTREEGVNRGNLVMQFARSKLAPGPGMAYDLLAHKTMIGQDVELTPRSQGNQFFNAMAPGMAQDIINALKEDGPFAAAAAGAVSGFGGSVTSYHTLADRQEQGSKQLFGKSYINLNRGERERINQLPTVKNEPPSPEQKIAGVAASQRRKSYEQELEATLAGEIKRGLKGPKLREAITEFQEQRRTASQVLFGGQAPPDNRPVEDQLGDKYWALKAPELAPGVPDFDALDRQRLQVLKEADAAGVSRKYITGTGEGTYRGHRFDDPTVRKAVEHKEAQQAILKPYWQLPDRVIPNAGALRMYKLYQAADPMTRQVYVRRFPGLRMLDARVAHAREAMRRTQPAVDAALAEEYGRVPIRQRQLQSHR